MSKNYHIAVLPGDGIGPEVMAQALKVLCLLWPLCIPMSSWYLFCEVLLRKFCGLINFRILFIGKP